MPGLQVIFEPMQEPYLPKLVWVCGYWCVCWWEPSCSVQAHFIENMACRQIVCDIAKFIGFAQFYSRFMHNFEIWSTPLCEITKQDFTNPVVWYWTDTAQVILEDMKNAILFDPCILRFNYRKPIILCTNFSSLGFGWVLCQPGDDAATNQTMHNYQAGKSFSVMTKDSAAVLHLVCFCSRWSHGNEVWLLLHRGEMIAGDYGINKCGHMHFSQRFVWVIDCYAAKFVLSYDGTNPAFIWLQMHLMCWDVNPPSRRSTCQCQLLV